VVEVVIFRRRLGFASAVEEGEDSSVRQIWPNDTAAEAAFKLREIVHGCRVDSALSAIKITLKTLYFVEDLLSHIISRP
jgi:hypothetical protein